ncbi:MAG: hypothetical protein SNJ54_05325 [Anaerolineae bacterium]
MMKRLWILVGLGMLLVPTFLSILQSAAAVCPLGYLPPRLQVGEVARVTLGGSPNRVRELPSTSAAFLGQLAPGTTFDVLEGPACVAGIAWWRVRSGSLIGWTAEGLFPDDYFLEPILPAGIERGMTAVAQATQNVSATQLVQTQTILATREALATATVVSAIMTSTAQALITPSSTPTTTPTPLPTATLPPLMPLPTERDRITPENVRGLVPLAILPVGLFSVFFAPDGSQVLLNGEFAYDLPSMQPSATFGGFPVNFGRVLATSPDLRYVIFRPYHTGWVPLHLWDTQATEPSARALDFLPLGNSIALSSGPRYLIAVADGEGYGAPVPPQLYIYDITNDRMTQILDNPAPFTAEVAFNRDASRVAATGSSLRLIEIDRAQWRIPVSGSALGAVVFRPVPANTPEQVAYGGGRGVMLADLGRGVSREFRITGGTLAGYISFSPDGLLMVTYGVEIHGDFDAPPPRFNLFNVTTGDLLIDSDYYRMGFGFSPDGTLLVVGTADGLTHILGVRP